MKCTKRAAVRTTGTLAAAFGLAISAAGPAQAHVVSYFDYVWANNDSSRCLQSYSETSHGNTGGGYFKGRAHSLYDPDLSPLDCVLGWERNTGDIGESMQVFLWFEDEWLLCFNTDQWYFNSKPAVAQEIYDRAPMETLCGPGYYGVNNYAIMRDNGEWHGGSAMWSGYHKLPADPSVSAGEAGKPTHAPPEAPPAWADAKPGSSDKVKVKVAGRDGKPLTGPDGKPVRVDAVPPAPATANGTTTGGKRTWTTDKDGNVTEKVEVNLVRPTP